MLSSAPTVSRPNQWTGSVKSQSAVPIWERQWRLALLRVTLVTLLHARAVVPVPAGRGVMAEQFGGILPPRTERA